MSALLEPNNALLAAAAVSMVVLFIVTYGLALWLRAERARLPAAVRLSELDELLGAKEQRLQYLDGQISDREVSLAERDQAEAEAEHWRSVVETVKAEYSNLDDQRREIEEVREEFRQAVEELGVREAELRQIRGDLEQARAEAVGLEERRGEAEARLAELAKRDNELAARFEGQQEQLRQLESRLSGLQEEKTTAAAEVERQRERLMGLKNEAEALERETKRLSEVRDAAETQLTSLRQELASLDDKRATLEALEEELSGLREQRTSWLQQIDDLEDRARRLAARVADLEEHASVEAGSKEQEDSVFDDLRKVPNCLAIEQDDGELTPTWSAQQPQELEHEALARVARLLGESGLEFPQRTINAFHTSLKTAVISPLTVLAGISGTGKSQLPRRYAEAMGMHFLKIPVQPRWDSPQDLFGFYNYIEKRYKATELARALVHMDPHNWPEESKDFQDRILLVLLDEMNLARVEYYFSEFLSRLEGRPTDAGAGDDEERGPAEIDIDVSRKRQTRRVYAGQNVLFVGTMNEDESTLTLSDKVLDRANVLRFPRPAELRYNIPAPQADHNARGFLPKTRWTQGWMKTSERLDQAVKTQTTRVIEDINGIMDEVGRPFGFRMSQAMLHYVANYPVASHQGAGMTQFQNGMADQVEQRIMPKLRGLDVTDHGARLRRLADLTGSSLNDQELAEAMEKSIQASETLGVFNWRGFTRRNS